MQLLRSATFVQIVEGRLLFPVTEHTTSTNWASAIFTKSPKAPGKVFLKATLFDTVSPKGGEVFGEHRLELWDHFASRLKYILLNTDLQL